jgi:hypothetical protein
LIFASPFKIRAESVLVRTASSLSYSLEAFKATNLLHPAPSPATRLVALAVMVLSKGGGGFEGGCSIDIPGKRIAEKAESKTSMEGEAWLGDERE